MISRHRTTEGVHPFDTVTWEMRTAIIGSPENPVFFQEGVEFPSFWSQNTTNIVADKYFRGKKEEKEHSVRQMISRVVNWYFLRAIEGGYFGATDAITFCDELIHLLLYQYAAFNSPVWFNVGRTGDNPPRVSACFTLSVEDSMESILQWVVDEGMVFKSGSGAGVNLSRLRESGAPLRDGGWASGPVSFMRGADASAGTIRSGGAARRAAKLVVLNVDHPDILEFITCKSHEEKKAHALKAAGFDVGIAGKDAFSLQYQNANNSVGCTDAFFTSVLDNTDWDLVSRIDGRVVKTVKARDLLRQIAQAAWECADPGVLYLDTMNAWHTSPDTGYLDSCNPCQPGCATVLTPDGIRTFDDIEVGSIVWSGKSWTTVTAKTYTGEKPVFRYQTRAGFFLGTAEHRVFQYGVRIEVKDADSIDMVTGPGVEQIEHGNSGVPCDPRDVLAGLVIGDGCVKVCNDGRQLYPLLCIGKNDQSYLDEPGLKDLISPIPFDKNYHRVETDVTKAETPSLPERIIPARFFSGKHDRVRGFLRGLYSANGSVVNGRVTLKTTSQGLANQVQQMLSALGITSYQTINKPSDVTFANGKTYTCRRSVDVNITAGRHAFRSLIGFVQPYKQQRLDEACVGKTSKSRKVAYEIVSIEDMGVMPVWDITVMADEHSYWTGGMLVSNCIEFVRNKSSCNLASIRLTKYLLPGGVFDVPGFVRDVELLITAMDVSISNAEYPTEYIRQNVHDYRELGLGYTDLGALLMRLGVPYDSDEGRAWAASITALLAGAAWRQSALLASVVGPYPGWSFDNQRNRATHMQVMRKHQDACGQLVISLAPTNIFDAAKTAWKEAIQMGNEVGFRNAQVTLLAPAGCVAADTHLLTSEGLLPVTELGNQEGPPWQNCDFSVAQESRVTEATRFFVNGRDRVFELRTVGGHRIKATWKHRLRVIDEDGHYVWRRMEEMKTGDTVVLRLGGHESVLTNKPYVSVLPSDSSHARATHLDLPADLDEQTAEIIGYYTGNGYLKNRGGLHLVVCGLDGDLEEYFTLWGHRIGINPTREERVGCYVINFISRALRRWFDNNDWSKPKGNNGEGAEGAFVPLTVLRSRTSVLSAYLRGLFEADGTVCLNRNGTPTVELSTVSIKLAETVHRCLESLGIASRLVEYAPGNGSFGARTKYRVRTASIHAALVFSSKVGFLSARKQSTLTAALGCTRGSKHRGEVIKSSALLRDLYANAAGLGHKVRQDILVRARKGVANLDWLRQQLRSNPSLTASRVGELLRIGDFQFQSVTSCVEVGYEETWDIAVPSRNTYLANGFVSHNTISFLLGCDTTGIEPDIALVKTKKLAGGGSMRIINQSVPAALTNLAYSGSVRIEILEHIQEKGTVIGSLLATEHIPVFACAIGDNCIAPMGHIRMMAAVQPFLDGSISKCVTGNTIVPTSRGMIRIASLHRHEIPNTFRVLEDNEAIMVPTGDGTMSAATHFYYGGVEPVYKVTLGDGRDIRGTAVHRLRVASDEGLVWKTLPEITEGDHVALCLGSECWGSDELPVVHISNIYGSQHACFRTPERGSFDLGLFLGMLTADGHVTKINYSVGLTKNCQDVLSRFLGLLHDQFGLSGKQRCDPRNDVTYVTVGSKSLVEWLHGIGFSKELIPDCVLGGTRDMAIGYLSGFYLDGSISAINDIAICQKHRSLLRDAQSLWDNLGIQTYFTDNVINGENYPVLHVYGTDRAKAASLLHWLEPHKRERAAAVKAGIDRRPFPLKRGVLMALLRENRLTTTFRSAMDPRTQNLGRTTFLNAADSAGVMLTNEERYLYYVPVVRVESDGYEEVYDLSVPGPEAFVGNGIVNHNTINVPNSATVEDIEELILEGWYRDLKALAIYRDGCKVDQPLNVTKQDTPAVLTTAAPIVRRKLPKRRFGATTSFRISDCKGYLRTGEYEDGTLGEVFLDIAKEGSTLSGLLDAFAMAVSLGLQHGVPLETFVRILTGNSFSPAGPTDDPEIPFTSSLVDYLLRRLAIDYLSEDTRRDLHVLSTREKMTVMEDGKVSTPREESHAPLCPTCGTLMRRAGACYACESCGITSGCS